MPTDPNRVQAAFLAAAELTDADARASCLDRECAGDAALRARVEALLKAHDQADSMLDSADGGETRTLSPGRDPDATHVEPAVARAFLAPPTRPDAIGRLQQYEILAVLGRGGFGTVYRAFDEKLHRVVAVKVLAPELAASGSARARFLREARSAAAVRDDHVINIHDVGERPIPYLVMEYVGGQTLQEKLDKTGSLPVTEVLRIGSQIARGLAAAHAQGLIHRDIKPANILLENGVERVKITDFGLARAADDASISQSGVVAGTPMYMAPEQAQGSAIDHRADLFSLGSVLYALCTGRPPFRAESALAVLKRVVEDRPRPVREVNPEVPDWLEAVIAKLHAKDPGDRFQSAKEVAELLRQHLAHLQQPATVPMPAPVAAPPDAPDTWKQIIEATDYRRRLMQFGVAFAMFIPFYVYVAIAALGWLNGRVDNSRLAVLVGFLVVHVAWCVASLWVLARMKHHWEVKYKGRTLRMQLSCYGTERLLVDGTVVARSGWGLTFQELRGTIPDGPGAGDRVRVLGQFGFLTPVCRILVSEGSPPTAGPGPTRFRRWARSAIWLAAIVVPIALIGWGLIPQGWVMVKVDDPDMVVLLDGDMFIGGQDVKPGGGPHFRGRSLRTGEHTLRALKGGRVVFDQTFHLGFNERKEFDLTRAALGGKGPATPEPAFVSLFNGKDLTGWKNHPDQPGTWKVEGGHLVGRGRMGLLYSDRGDFGDFDLHVEAKVNDGGYGGVFVRVPGFPPIRRDPFADPKGHRVVLSANSRHEPSFGTGSMKTWTPTGYMVQAHPTGTPPDEWFSLDILTRGPEVFVRVNGKQTAQIGKVAEKSHQVGPTGHLVLETEGDDTVIEVRKIEVRELPAK